MEAGFQYLTTTLFSKSNFISFLTKFVFEPHYFRIENAMSVDSGVYTCYAKNGVGTISTHSRVMVRINGGWSDWQQWSDCSASCGNGTRIRRRFCNNPIPANGGRECLGPESEVEMCNERPCPVDGQWSDWTEWSECSVSCGEGFRQRSRICREPLNGGRKCHGEEVEVVICQLEKCAVNGGWSNWLPWQPCSKTCGNGTQKRIRLCDSPTPDFGGMDCEGENFETRVCNSNPCPIHGHWSEWSPWSICSVSCGGGTRERKRTCTAPEPGNGGRLCPGKDTQVDFCNSQPCPVHGHWSDWTPWGDCSASCGGTGLRKRFRICDNPKPKDGGRDCSGPNEQIDQCASQPCPSDQAIWSHWSQWSPCSKACGGGTKTRHRSCTKKDGSCLGETKQAAVCNIHRCNSPQPRSALGKFSGQINDIDLPQFISLATNFSNRDEEGNFVDGVVNGLNIRWSSTFQVVVNLLTPLYWITASPHNDASNGFDLTRGHFNHCAVTQFASGEKLVANISASGVDEQGLLLLNIYLDGSIPEVAGYTGAQFVPSKIKLHPLREKLIQSGPGEIYSTYSHVLHIGDYVVPYSKVQTISYDPSNGRMPFLVESLHLADWSSDIETTKGMEADQVSVKFGALASVNRVHDGVPHCPSGFLLEENGQYCKGLYKDF